MTFPPIVAVAWEDMLSVAMELIAGSDFFPDFIFFTRLEKNIVDL